MEIKTPNPVERKRHSLPRHILLPGIDAICPSARGFNLVAGNQLAHPEPEVGAVQEPTGALVSGSFANRELLTVADVAVFLHVPRSWVYERTRRRGAERLPHIKVGKYLRFRLYEIERYLETLRSC